MSSTRLADSLQADDWLMVSQEVSFRTDDAGNTITFLRLLRTQARLQVRDFSLNRSHNQYNGSITVVGLGKMSRGEAMTDNHTADIPAMGPVNEASFQMTLPVFVSCWSRSALLRH